MLQAITVSPFHLSWNTVLGILLGQYATHCIPVIWLIFTFIYSYESKVVAVHTIKTYRGSRGVAILILGLNITWRQVVTSHLSCFTPRDRISVPLK